MGISRVAYLSICNHTHQHACVVLPDGKTSHEFMTKQEGSDEVDRLLAHRDIEADEAAFLKDQIWDSSLPLKRCTLSVVLVGTVQPAREAVMHGPFDSSVDTDDEEAPTYH